MHPAVATSIATELDYFLERIKHGWGWPSPGSGFVVWLDRTLGHPTLVTTPSVDGLAELDDGRLGEAPVLAAYGFLLAEDKPGVEAIQAWCNGISRLSTRDSLPGDRASFFFRPLELLGLAVGAAAVAQHDTHASQWLRKVMQEGTPRLGTDTRSVVFAARSCAALGMSPALVNQVGPVNHACAADLAVMWLLAFDLPDTAQAVGISSGPDAIESLLLASIMGTREPDLDVADAAVTHAAVTSAVRTGLTRPDYGRPAALSTVSSVCRRFQAIVRELNKRHNHRTPLFAINDEYDVQDLLRGVLSGLFDDVRDEENTPSRGGVRSRVDILLKREQIVIETKMTRATLDQRKVAKELAIDKEFYRSHPDCKTLVCFVYDPGRLLSNPTALEDDLSDEDGSVPTVVIVAPR